MASTKTLAPYRVNVITRDGVSQTAHRSFKDAMIMIQIVHDDAFRNGIRAQVELVDIRDEVA
jgi:hypothetical protein